MIFVLIGDTLLISGVNEEFISENFITKRAEGIYFFADLDTAAY